MSTSRDKSLQLHNWRDFRIAQAWRRTTAQPAHFRIRVCYIHLRLAPSGSHWSINLRECKTCHHNIVELQVSHGVNEPDKKSNKSLSLGRWERLGTPTQRGFHGKIGRGSSMRPSSGATAFGATFCRRLNISNCHVQ
jgi:hypothetical protein